ncbi:uncharacterized protein LOC122938340 isoform X1 [Bufo gargarizans]|uniref:uncharacterized protein LOC122938340 isoform X1 n=1 Tax=Bufo gargarizans TaxID=30331 RepID=UPI001CF38719|nr:uncharacterized protein LOC122938340 isoform X1 [Bufo gargarizans]
MSVGAECIPEMSEFLHSSALSEEKSHIPAVQKSTAAPGAAPSSHVEKTSREGIRRSRNAPAICTWSGHFHRHWWAFGDFVMQKIPVRLQRSENSAQRAIDNLRDKFIIKETVCVKSAEKDGKCPFKEDGVVKRCTASKPEGRRLEVRCQTIDIAGEENTKSETARNHHIFKDLRNDRKKAESSFMQIEKDSVSSHAVFSCLHCIFDFLNPKTSSKDSGR